MSGQTHNSPARREEALLSWIRQFAPYGIATLDESFRVQSWNHWLEIHSGLNFVDVVGKSLFTLFPDLHERRITAHFERALKGEASVLSTTLHRYLLPLRSTFRQIGSPHMLQTARIAPLFSEEKICGIVLVIEDVTQRETQAEALARQHRRDELLSWALAQLLKTDQPRKAARQLFFKVAEQLDFDAFLVYLRNPETGALTLDAAGGIPADSEKDFIACPFTALLPAKPHEIVVVDSIFERKGPEYESLKKAGMSTVVVAPLFSNARELGLLCFSTATRSSIQADESDLIRTIAQYLATALDRENTSELLRNAKQQLSDHAQTLESRVQERTARLQETISELETFSYTIAHDLKAPARATTGYCEVVLEDFADEISPQVKKVVERIARSSRRMETLTRDLLEFTRISQTEVRLSRVEIEPILYEVVRHYVPAVRDAITIRAPLHPVQAHKALLEHVLSNLIDNAVKFVAPKTSPKITISADVISRGSPSTRSRALLFSSTESPSDTSTFYPQAPFSRHVRICVRDEGIGIPREAHQKIFGIFERGVTSDLYQGTGIGLAIVARAMQRMGGTCGVESEPGKGSRFWLDLPAA